MRGHHDEIAFLLYCDADNSFIRMRSRRRYSLAFNAGEARFFLHRSEVVIRVLLGDLKKSFLSVCKHFRAVRKKWNSGIT